MININRTDHFERNMAIPSLIGVHSARIVCFAGHTLPNIDIRHANDAVRAGIVFG
jgi:hypothetical protein